MKLEDQVCSLESAKKLKELGVKQDSLWYWHYITGCEGKYGRWEIIDCDVAHNSLRIRNKLISAFTCAELGKMLPVSARSRKLFDSENSFIIDALGQDKFFVNKNEAEARAKMLIYLLESKLIEI